MKLINFVVLLSLWSICSCIKKDKDDEELILKEGDIGYASEHSYMQSVNNDIISIADAAATSGNASLGSCVEVTNNTIEHKLTIDFGPYSPCKGADGKRRNGKIIVNYTGSYHSAGSVHTFTFDEYNVEDIGVYGSFTVLNKGTNNNGQAFCTITGRDTILKYRSSTPDAGRLIFLEMQLERAWVDGSATIAREDDVFEIKGGMKIRNERGQEYASTINAPLSKRIDCQWLSSGQIALGLPNISSRMVNYGTGTCDNKATLHVEGKEVSVDLYKF